MYQINDNYQKLPGSYLFSDIAKKVRRFPTRTRMRRSSVSESEM